MVSSGGVRVAATGTVRGGKMIVFKACHRCGGDLEFRDQDGGEWRCVQCGRLSSMVNAARAKQYEGEA